MIVKLNRPQNPKLLILDKIAHPPLLAHVREIKVEKSECKKIYSRVNLRVTLQALLVQTSGGGSTRSTACEAHFHCKSAGRGVGEVQRGVMGEDMEIK